MTASFSASLRLSLVRVAHALLDGSLSADTDYDLPRLPESFQAATADLHELILAELDTAVRAIDPRYRIIEVDSLYFATSARGLHLGLSRDGSTADDERTRLFVIGAAYKGAAPYRRADAATIADRLHQQAESNGVLRFQRAGRDAERKVVVAVVERIIALRFYRSPVDPTTLELIEQATGVRLSDNLRDMRAVLQDQPLAGLFTVLACLGQTSVPHFQW